ncbi:hemerythrin domain-containing protein [Gracilibacillus marinus]|uniref:Hemerythrin domain-containing protein n=1 Tax=Gracilibacillus marinus TaxID=630535 RepID=A0ABV8VWN1_9BACI
MLYCAAIQQLINEHQLLRNEINACFDLTEEIEIAEEKEAISYFLELYQLLLSFSKNLTAHSLIEEEGLFPMISAYLGEGDTTIEQMEIEHQKAENFLAMFFQETEQELDKLDELIAQSLTVYVVQAYDTLMQHFSKEEKQLFPLGEKILSDREKEELLLKMGI